MSDHPAARKTDPHTCPAVDVEVIERSCWWNGEKKTPHVGGPIMEGSPDVNINGLPAARCTDTAACEKVGAAPMIVTGPPTININGRRAAMVTSRVVHQGAVTGGSPDVFYGGTAEGITLGDHEAGTAACKKAAEGRNKTTDVEGNKKSSQEQQSMPKNCGPETVRQMCIQECMRNPSNKKACEACNTSEADWYARFVRDKKIQELHNKNENQKKTERDDANKAAAEELGKAKTIEKQDADGDWNETSAPSDWLAKEKNSSTNHQHAGKYRVTYPDGTTKVVTLQHGYSTTIIDADPDKNKYLVEQGTAGSFPDERAHMLKEWCGYKEVTEGENTEKGIGKDMADGKEVNAVVDIAKLPGNGNSKNPSKKGLSKREEAHVVQVTEMKYDDEGNLVHVYVNDTSYGGGCGRKLSGEEFNHALIEGRKTDVATRPEKS